MPDAYEIVSHVFLEWRAWKAWADVLPWVHDEAAPSRGITAAWRVQQYNWDEANSTARNYPNQHSKYLTSNHRPTPDRGSPTIIL